MLFNTKFNSAEAPKPKLNKKEPLNPVITDIKQRITLKERDSLKLLENRKIFGSHFDNFEFEAEKDQFGKFSK